MIYSTITFYKYEKVENPKDVRDTLRLLCEELNLLGRIIIGKEGLNAGVSGKKEDVEEFKSEICKVFDGLIFKEHSCEKNSYHKLVVRSRNEVVNFDRDVDLNKIGKYVEPKELKSMIDNNEDFVLLDARNNYEFDIGKFKGAKTLPIKNFREFSENIKDLDKNRKIVMYCTGGIRCEKASAYLNEEGFKDVSQLQGGVINYLEQFNDGNFEGNLFVFDDRLVTYDNEPIGSCYYCAVGSDGYINCYNMDCDKLFICCKNCQVKMNKTCSEECKSAPRRRLEVKERTILGVVTNYFAKLNVAEIKTLGRISKNSKILIEGKTTKKFEQEIIELRNNDCNPIKKCYKQELVTFPVSERVRVNDKVFVYS